MQKDEPIVKVKEWLGGFQRDALCVRRNGDGDYNYSDKGCDKRQKSGEER